MLIKYTFADGTVSEVEVDEELGNLIMESRQDEENLARKERYHCFSVESSVYEGKELSTNDTPEKILQLKIDNVRKEKLFADAMDSLSEIQRRRLLMLIDGLTLEEIGRCEGVSFHSVAKSIWEAKKIFLKFFPEMGSKKGR